MRPTPLSGLRSPACETQAPGLNGREELVACIAHDLMSLLAAIRLSARCLSGASMPKKQAAAVALIVDSAERMKFMALDLLNESQPVATRDRLKLRTMTSDVLLERVAALMQPMAEDAHVRLIVVPGTDSTRLAIDYERMLRVFSNLIGNAIKFSAPGGSVVVSADAVTGGVRFSVSDRGPGVAPEHLLRVFDRHWQATPHPQRGGFGLGLPIAKRLVEAHGGVIGVTSAPAGGATFHFTLPAAPAE